MFRAWAAIAAAVLVLAACGRPENAAEPARIVVQHLLVSFKGRLPGKNVERSEVQAKELAEQLLQRARGGEDFGALVKQYTDDQAPGLYTMVAAGQSPAAGEYSRDQMVPGFADTSFRLAVGEIGLCRYDGVKSPFGFHLIKRIQ
jgi:parvulin-like peptidyl-prolyl isomerase